MLQRSRPWLLTLILPLALLTACDSDSPTEPTPPADPNVVGYAAIGASDALGVGGSVPCFLFTECPDGTGYVQTTARRLRGIGRTVNLTNLGIPGATLGPEIQAIGNSLGRGIQANFLDQMLPFVPRSSTLVTVFAGGNDINAIGAAVQAGRGGTDPTGYVVTQTNNFGRDMRALISGIRDRAPNARVVVFNLPNFGGLPLATPLTLTEKRLLQAIAVGFSSQVNLVATQGALVIDLMCDARSYAPANYSADGFPPDRRRLRVHDRRRLRCRVHRQRLRAAPELPADDAVLTRPVARQDPCLGR